MKPVTTFLCLSAFLFLVLMSHAGSLGNEFSYSGVLQTESQPAQGGYDLRLALYDAAANGTQIQDAVTNVNVAVSNGVFRTTIDFGPGAFDGRAAWLEVAVRPTDTTNDFEVLTPRQALLAVPNALHALTAGTAQTAVSAETATSATSAVTAATATTAESLSPNAVTTVAIQDETITAAKIAPGQVVKSLNGLQDHVLLSAGANIVLDADGNSLTLSSPVWSLSGNQGTTAGAEFLGTTDDQPLELKVHRLRALRLTADTNAVAVNVIAGSPYNEVSNGAYAATIGGGGGQLTADIVFPQIVRSTYATIGGGGANTIDTNADASTVSGGFSNRVSAMAAEAVIAGGSLNRIGQDAWRGTISGGWMHTIADACYHSVIAGGWSNSIVGHSSVISGGIENLVDEGARFSVIGGGGGNIVEAGAFTGTISGGGENVIMSGSYRSTIGGGKLNAVGPDSPHSTIGGGYTNRILDNAEAATIPGGAGNSVAGAFGFAAGHRATAQTGAFVWADSVDADFASQTDNEFAVRATGGLRMVSAVDENGQPTAGVALAAGSGSWSTLSDRASKRNFEPADPRQILARLATLPIQTWNYAQQDISVRHLGPMAQDFRAAFHVGENDRTISAVDADGVALAAIQGLHALVLEQQSKLEARDARIERLERDLAELKKMVTGRGDW